MKLKIVILIIIIVVIILSISYIHYIQQLNIKSLSKKPLVINYTTTEHGKESIEIIVLIDNYQYLNNLKTTWGISIYVNVNNFKILFDTGPNPKILEYNSKKLGINLSKINVLVLSHEHRDHIGGLPYILTITKNITIYIPANSYLVKIKKLIESYGHKVVIVNNSLEIYPNIYIIGPLKGPPNEISLSIKTSNGLIIIVGCSHPGIINIVKEAIKITKLKPYIIIGGFHMIGYSKSEVERIVDKLVEFNVSYICAIHCSGDNVRKYIIEKYPEKFCFGGVGFKIKIN